MVDKDFELNVQGKVLTSTGIPPGQGPTAIFVPVGESIDDHITQCNIEFPKIYKTAGLFVQIDNCEEVCVMTKHSEAETIVEPFTIEFKAIKIPEGFKGKYNHW